MKWINSKNKTATTRELNISLFKEYHDNKESLSAPAKQALRNKILLQNKELVLYIVNKDYGKSVPEATLQDLYQEGMLAIFKAIEKFDPSMGNAFSTYAVLWIKQYINKYLLSQTYSIRTPPNLINIANKTRRAIDKFKLENNGLDPTIEEISEKISTGEDKITPKMIRVAASVVASQATSSLDEIREIENNTDSGRNPNLYNIISSNDEVKEFITDEKHCLKVFKETFETLSHRERSLIFVRYGIISSVNEYATMMNISLQDI